MKKFFKIFLVFLFVLFNFSLNNCLASNNIKIINNCCTQIQNYTDNTSGVILPFSKYDKAIVSANNDNYEISALKSDKECSFYTSDNKIIDNNQIKIKFKVYANKILNSKFYNITPNLIYEICTRAP